MLSFLTIRTYSHKPFCAATKRWQVTYDFLVQPDLAVLGKSSVKHLWHYHEDIDQDPQTKIQALPAIPTLFLSVRASHKSPSKQRYDRERSIKRRRVFQERHEQRLRLFGYVLLTNGEVLSIDDAIARLRDGMRAEENPNITGGIDKDDILEWHQPESYRDVLDSLGEIDAVEEYPALQVSKGDVLVDPKLRYRHPALSPF
jgi:hypothetical protein